jgi:uncharacterized protein (TIGR02246 family)
MGNKRRIRARILETSMKRLLLYCKGATLAMAAAVFVFPAHAVENESRDAETAAIRAMARQYLDAKRRGDVEAMRAAWTPDGDYVDANGSFAKPSELKGFGPDGVRDEAPRETPLPRTRLRFITSEVAIEDGTIEPDSAAGDSPAGRFTAVWVKRDSRWLLDSLRESACLSANSNPRLQELTWLLGEWAGKADDSAMLISARWSDGGNYIVREFVVRNPDGQAITGTQRIGWDPVARRIKSWSFDSHGGAGEAMWRQDGPKWIVESADATSDGKKARSLTVYTPDGDNRFVWEVRNANVGEEKIPPRRVEFTRAPETD